MCQWGNEVPVEVKIAADLSHTGQARRAVKGIDACIAPIVQALQEGGIDMRASCCGHGKRPGSIQLADGRTLIIVSEDTPHGYQWLAWLGGDEVPQKETT